MIYAKFAWIKTNTLTNSKYLKNPLPENSKASNSNFSKEPKKNKNPSKKTKKKPKKK
jgi:hypothetical protein